MQSDNVCKQTLILNLFFCFHNNYFFPQRFCKIIIKKTPKHKNPTKTNKKQKTKKLIQNTAKTHPFRSLLKDFWFNKSDRCDGIYFRNYKYFITIVLNKRLTYDCLNYNLPQRACLRIYNIILTIRIYKETTHCQWSSYKYMLW